MEEINRYEKYKDSGIEWIGEIPVHWDIKRVKFIISNELGIQIGPFGSSLRSEFIRNVGYKIYGQENVIKDDFTLGYKYLDEDKFNELIKYELFPGDIVITMMGTTGKCKIVTENIEKGIMDSHLIRIRVNNDKILEKFFAVLINDSYSIMNNIKYESKGSIMEGLNSSIIKSLYIPLPNINEQSSIINFIYRKTAEIDCIIANKQKLISLYEEEKQAVINRAVIRGLNVNCELKRISEEWIGEIPKHWEIKKVKLICKIQGRIGFKGYKTSDLVFDGNGAITLGATHITKFNKIDLSEPVYLSWDKYYESPEIMVKEGDIVFTQRGAYLGKVGLIDKDYGDVTINPSLILLKNIKIHAPYLAYYLTSNYIRKSVDVISNSTAIPMISQEQLANFYCLIPPIEEQVEISKFIEEKNIASDRLIEKVKNQIELLQEYRTTLISEVVTGKIKVPNTIEA